MKIIKIVLLGVLFLIMALLLLAVFAPKHYTVQKHVIINASKFTVFNYIKLLKNEKHYNVLTAIDSDIQRSYRGTDGTIGFVSAWKSNDPQIGEGEKEIIKLVDATRIDYQFRLFKPLELTIPEYLEIDVLNENKTKLTWGFTTELPYPINILLLIPGGMEDDEAIVQNSLIKLKSLLENKPDNLN